MAGSTGGFGSSSFSTTARPLGIGNSFGASSSNWLTSITKPKTTGYVPPAFPQSVGVQMPWSSSAPKPFVPRGDTTGDFIGSLGASFDNALWQNGYLNVANAIPWAEERTFVAAKAMADSVVGDGNPISGAIDAFAGLIKNVAEPVAKVFEWFPNTIRDTQLNQRASVYKALVKGESVGPLETILGQILSSVGVNSASLTAQGVNAGNVDPLTRQVLAAAIDLPDSVKREIEGNPEGDIAKYLDKAPEGRQFSYMGGIGGAALNLASMGVLYGMEIMATGGAAALARTASGGATVGANVFGYAAGASRASNLYGVTAAAASGMAKAQKLFLASGISYFGASIMTDAVLRTMGNKEGVALLDKLNRTALISDSPAVQLVSAFTVNPISAAKMAAIGEIKFLGTPLIVVDKVTGGRFLRTYTHEDVVLGILGKMYGTTPARAAELIGPGLVYESKAQAFDQVLALAVDAFVQKLPEAAKASINALPRHMRTEILFARYSKQILDEVDSPQGLIARFRRDWSYHDLYGEFDPNIAKVVTRDYAVSNLKYAEAREATDTVPAYVRYLNPEGQGIVGETIEGIFADGRQGTLRDLNMLSAKHPSLNGLVHDLVAKGDGVRPFSKPGDIVPREVFDTALERAKQMYATARKDNPVGAATGVDPVLRPNAHASEWAAALDTSPETIAALGKASGRTPAQEALIAGFLRQKTPITEAEIAASTADDLFAKALAYFDKTTDPWVQRGEIVADAEAQIGKALSRAADQNLTRNERNAATAEAGQLQALLADVRDPAMPFASTVKFGERAETQIVKDARRKVDAAERLETIKSVTDEVKPAQILAFGDLLHSVTQVNGVWTWMADALSASAVGPKFDAAVSLFKGWAFKGKYNRQNLRRFENEQTPVGQLQQMSASDGFMLFLRGKGEAPTVASEVGGVRAETVTHAEVADLIAAAKPSSTASVEITPAMIEALGVADRDAFIAKLVNLRGVYDDALSGKTEAALGHTANIPSPQYAVDYAKTNGAPASVFRDPGMEAGYANAVNDLKTALDTAPAAVRSVVEGNPLLLAQARQLATAKGQTVGDFLANPANADSIRSLLPAVLPDRYVPGMPKALTPLDEAILATDNVGLTDAKIDLEAIRGTIAPPLKNVPIEAVNSLASVPRVSVRLADDLNDAGIHWNALIPEALWEKSPAGANALAVILTGSFGQRPKTIMGLLDTLKQIENGNAANMGMGAQLAAEAQNLAGRVVGNMVADVRKASLEVGVLGMGKNLNPRTWTQDTNRMIQELFAQEKAANNLLIFRDESGLQYGLAQRPKGAIVADMDSVPGLAEELLIGRFQPWQQRVGAVRANQAFERMFVRIPNQQITFEARARFETAMAKVGVPAQAAEQVWSAWRAFAKESRGTKTKVDKATLERYFEPASSALYATEKNIPNSIIDRVARGALEKFYRDKGGIPHEVKVIDFQKEMRTAGSFTRRQLNKVPVLGDHLGDFYGMFAHNEWVTTKYFMFRFGLDSRFHAQNKLEGAALDYGRAGLKIPEIDKGMFGMNQKAVQTIDELDTISNAGYPFAVTREARIYNIFRKEQPDAIRGVITEDPALMRRAMKEIADNDPELSDFIAHNGHTTETYMQVMDAYYGKLMKSADPEALIQKELMQEVVNTPELAEVYSRIYDRNAELIGNIRAMMYGNPSRSQAERTLNSFLLYWPISYQIKATKWLLGVMYGKIGGVQTGGLGAYALDRMQADHERKLIEDPEYGAFFEEHPTLVFAAQMLLPMTPAGMSVGLSPVLRDIFFPETSKSILSMGPVYTITKFIPGILGDIYPSVRDIPVVGEMAGLVYKAGTGWLPPKPKVKSSPFTPVP